VGRVEFQVRSPYDRSVLDINSKCAEVFRLRTALTAAERALDGEWCSPANGALDGAIVRFEMAFAAARRAA